MSDIPSNAESFPGYLPGFPGVLHEDELANFSMSLRGGEQHIDLELGNRELPTFAFKNQIIETVKENPVTIIVAETGAGKSTQVPQFLHEAGYDRIFLTQPRRAAARNVFNRIRDEFTEVRGKNFAEFSVAYQTAGINDREGPENAPIKVVTDGLQLVQELHDKGSKDNDVLIIDEVHEWNSNVEILIAWTKRAIQVHPDLRVVIMSATMNSQHLADYYSEYLHKEPPVIKIPGRSFPVERHIRPDSTSVEVVLEIVSKMVDDYGELKNRHNGILVFEAGKRDIYDTIDTLSRQLSPDILAKTKLMPLHSKLSEAEQQDAIDGEDGKINIVVSTNVAQTSLTIPYITHVVDSGFEKQHNIDGEGTRGLRLVPVSQADCNQRAGRTGRVAPGEYYSTKKDSNKPYVHFFDRDPYPIAAFLRSDAAQGALRLKELDIDIAEFDTLHKASRWIMELAHSNLQYLDALDENREITKVGRFMNMFPLSPSSARMMVEALRYKKQTQAYIAAVTASREAGDLRYYDGHTEKGWETFSDESTSDLLLQLDLFMAAQGMSPTDMVTYNLDVSNVKRANENFEKICKLLQIEPKQLVPATQQEREDILRTIYSGFIHAIYERTSEGTYTHAHNVNVFTHREIGNRSCVEGHPAMIIGDPYNVEVFKGSEPTIIPVIENVTKIDPGVLGSVAARHVRWDIEDYAFREGKVFERQRQVFFEKDLGFSREIPAEPSPALRHEIIKTAIENPGYAQVQLRALKEQLEKLNHRSRTPLRVITHNMLQELVEEAAPDDITTPSTIEDNLAQMMRDPERGLNLDSFVPVDIQDNIVQNSPDQIEIEGIILNIIYSNHKAIVLRVKLEQIRTIKADHAFLPDGRELVFKYRNNKGNTKKYTLLDLKTMLGE